MPTPRTLESGGSIVAGDRTPLAARIAEKPAPGAPGDGARKRVCGILGLRDPDDDYQCGRFRWSIVLGWTAGVGAILETGPLECPCHRGFRQSHDLRLARLDMCVKGDSGTRGRLEMRRS
jgi:hypothetical protein